MRRKNHYIEKTSNDPLKDYFLKEYLLKKIDELKEEKDALESKILSLSEGTKNRHITMKLYNINLQLKKNNNELSSLEKKLLELQGNNINHEIVVNDFLCHTMRNNITVRIIGYLYSCTGYGTGCRNIILTLSELPFLDIYVDPIYENEKFPELFKGFDRFVKPCPPIVDLTIIVQSPSSDLFKTNSRLTIWYWYWEADIILDKIVKFLRMHPDHIVMSPTSYMERIMEKSGVQNRFFKAIHWHLPNPIQKSKNSGNDEQQNDVKFYTIAQDVPRKNLELLLGAYMEEFTIKDNIVFTVKITKHLRPLDTLTEMIENLKTEISPRINLITAYLIDEQISELHANNDVFVLAQHSEGWGIPHIEALLSGNPLVTVNYGSLPDFVSSSNAFEIPFEEKIIERENLHYEHTLTYYPPNAKWGICTKEDIKKQMRNAYNNFKEKIPDAIQTASQFSKEVATEQWISMFRTLYPHITFCENTSQVNNIDNCANLLDSRAGCSQYPNNGDKLYSQL